MITSRVEAFASSINEIDESDKYLALHKSADTGTIIFVKNQMIKIVSCLKYLSIIMINKIIYLDTLKLLGELAVKNQRS